MPSDTGRKKVHLRTEYTYRNIIYNDKALCGKIESLNGRRLRFSDSLFGVTCTNCKITLYKMGILKTPYFRKKPEPTQEELPL